MLLVLVFHFDLVSGGGAGFIGVDVFFVISGFLITSILRRQINEGTLSLRSFYLGRIRRLAPSLLVTLVAVLVTGSALLFPNDFVELATQVLASQFYVANIYFWRNINYFWMGASNAFLLHTWSLAVEEQFYLFYPLAVIAIHKYARRYFWHAITIGLFVSFSLNIAFVGRKPEATFYLLPTRAWELLTGALVPIIALKWFRSRAVDELLGVLGIVLIFGGVVHYRADILFPGFFAVLPVGGAAFLLLSGTNRVSVISHWLGAAPISYIGKISYPLYLVHWPVNVFAGAWLETRYGLEWRLAMFILSIGLAISLYHFVENPIRHRRILALDKRLLHSYGAGLALTVGFFVLVIISEGLPQRFPKDVVRIAAFVNDKSPMLEECSFKGQILSRTDDFCKIGVPGVAPKWIVYGDSHAWAAHSAFDQWLKLKGESGLFAYKTSCPPIVGLHVFGGKGECFAFNRAVANFVGERADIKNVVLVSTWREASEARLSTSADVQLSVAESIALFDEKFSSTLDDLYRKDKTIYVWEPVPGARRSVPLALARAALENRDADIELTRVQYKADNEFFFTTLAKNRHLIAVTFSPSDALCQSGRCAATIDGEPLYFDNAHVTESSAGFWVKMMQRDEQQALLGSVHWVH